MQLEKDKILELSMNDVAMAIEIIDVYISSQIALTAQFEEAEKAIDIEKMQKTSHALIGTVGVLSLSELTARLREVETFCKNKNFDAAVSSFAKIRSELSLCESRLGVIRQELKAQR